MRAAHGTPLYDGSLYYVGYIGEQNVLAELLRDDGAGCAGSLADTQCQMAGGPPHSYSQVPAAGGLGIHHKAFNQVGAEVPRCLVSKQWHCRREPHIVVNTLWHLDNLY